MDKQLKFFSAKQREAHQVAQAALLKEINAAISKTVVQVARTLHSNKEMSEDEIRQDIKLMPSVYKPPNTTASMDVFSNVYGHIGTIFVQSSEDSAANGSVIFKPKV